MKEFSKYGQELTLQELQVYSLICLLSNEPTPLRNIALDFFHLQTPPDKMQLHRLERIIAFNIYRIREKLGDMAILNFRGKGYVASRVVINNMVKNNIDKVTTSNSLY